MRQYPTPFFAINLRLYMRKYYVLSKNRQYLRQKEHLKDALQNHLYQVREENNRDEKTVAVSVLRTKAKGKTC